MLPLIVEEHSSDHATRYYEANPELVASWGAGVECASALARLQRDGALEARDLTQALRQLQVLQSAWNEVQPLDTVHVAAQRLFGRGTGRGPPSTAGVGICLLGCAPRRRGRARGIRHR